MKNKVIEMQDLYDILNSNKIKSCSIEITNTCSFKCDHCYVEKSRKQMMTFDTFKNIIDQLLDLNCNSILITGGECTLNPEFIKMYLYAKQKGMFVNINSNGFHFSEEIKNTFKEYEPDLIEITLYGYDNETYEQFTHVKDSYDNVMNTLNFLKENNFKFNLKGTVTKDNYKYIYKLREIANRYNVSFRYDYIIFPKLNDIGHGRNALSITPEQVIEVIKQDKLDVAHFTKQVKKIKEMEKENNHIDNIFECQVARGIIFIDAFGYIKPCTVVSKKYNISDWSISDAVDDMQEYFDGLKFTRPSKCQDCHKRLLCRYCPGRFFLENGRYDVPSDFYCEVADLMIEEFK
jgi:MoaA/NifB/PqqE/SkfB family radical SAM enzyme